MNKLHYALFTALIISVVYILSQPEKVHNTLEQQLKMARDSLNTSLAFQDSIILANEKVIDSIEIINDSLEKESKRISINHEKVRSIIITADDSQLVRLISVQHPPVGY